MKISIIGYGKTGKEIELLAKEMKIEICSIIDVKGGKNIESKITGESISHADVCIDFTEPNSAFSNISQILELGKPVVVGTTGWLAKIDDVKKLIEKSDAGLIYSPNFSMGMVLFQRATSSIAKIFGQFKEYDCSIREIHHRMKKDGPSGTALSLSNHILEQKNKKELKIVREVDTIKESDLTVSFSRVGWNLGDHEIIFDSEFDTISFRHTVRSRRGFAYGALLSAKWIINKRGLYNFIDCFDEIIKT